MVDRQEVEALLELVDAEKGRWSPHVPPATLAALCRAWLAMQEAPEAVVECNDAKGAWLIAADGAPLSEGQRVRIVKEGE